MGYIYVSIAIFFAICSQLLLKWRIGSVIPKTGLPDALFPKAFFLVKCVLTDPGMLLCFFCTFVAGVLWVATVSKLPINVAYPITSLAYVFVLILSVVLFHESFNLHKLIGVTLIVAGVIFSSQA